MSPVRDQLRLIALKARQWAEDNKPSFINRNLEMMCARASGELFKKLKRAGFKPVLVFEDCHCYVVCNRYIIDITATQYNYWSFLEAAHRKDRPYNRVEIVRYETGRKDRCWNGEIVFRTTDIRKALEHQAETGWPKGQWVLA